MPARSRYGMMIRSALRSAGERPSMKRAAFEAAAGIDEDRASVRCANHDPVALADVEGDDRKRLRRPDICGGGDEHASRHDGSGGNPGAPPEQDRSGDDCAIVSGDRPRRRRRHRQASPGNPAMRWVALKMNAKSHASQRAKTVPTRSPPDA